MMPNPNGGKKSKKGRGREGLGEKTLTEYCRVWVRNNECSAYLGPTENIVRIGCPDWPTSAKSTRADLLQRADHGAARHDGTFEAEESESFLDALWWDMSAEHDAILGKPWLLFLIRPSHHSDKTFRDVYEAIIEVRKKAGGNRRRREIYYLLVLMALRSEVSIRNQLRIRTAALVMAQRERDIFPHSRTSSWDKSSVDLNREASPLLKGLPSDPREALNKVLDSVSSVHDHLGYLRNRPYEFLPYILSGPDIEDIGREQHAEQLDAFISGSRQRPFFSIAGRHGTGKTTFLRAYLKAQAAKGCLFACFFTDWRKGQRCQPQRILEHLMIEANPSYVLDLGTLLPTDEREAAERFWQAITCFTGEVPAKRIVIFLDAQDETENNPYGQLSLTEIFLRAEEDGDLPPGVRFVLSSRPSEGFKKLVGTYDIDFDASPVQSNLVAEYLDRELRSQGIDAPGATIQELAQRCRRSFTHADLLVRRIIEYGGLPDSLDMLPTKPDDVLKSEWQRFQSGPLNKEETRTLFGVLLAHLGTPSLSELCDMTEVSADALVQFFGIHKYHVTV